MIKKLYHLTPFQIRMSLEDWKETLQLHDDLQEQGHLDALYVFHKMRLDKAFMFTATHSTVGQSKTRGYFSPYLRKLYVLDMGNMLSRQRSK